MNISMCKIILVATWDSFLFQVLAVGCVENIFPFFLQNILLGFLFVDTMISPLY